MRAELLPELARQQGPRHYRAFWTEGDQAVSVGIFETEDVARQSTDAAGEPP